MQTISTIGLDIAKSVFQVHGVDAAGQVAVRRQLKRRYVLAFFQKLPSCLVGIEACASSHYWSRELQALGHTVRLMPPAYVRPYVKRQKNDSADAEAICEAVTRPNMRFVPTKSIEQQGCLVASARPWPRLWLPALLILRSSGQDGTSRLGLGSFRSRTRAGARTSWATSANKAIVIYAACSRLVRWP
jgi:hypothetical protein